VTDFLRVNDLRKIFDGGHPAIDGLSFGVPAGKIVTLLGPSGCGKTTTLRCIAGLEQLTAGTIVIEGEDVTAMAPERRNIGMVFQSYAVWPHMTVAQNLELPLQIRHIPPDERRQLVDDMLELVGLSGLGQRYANRLSGGQQQRVALARALIYRPRLLLFDEPLSNLDAKLREQMRHEIRRLQREVGVTSVYVTHDQAEAMIISDHIIVMNLGRVEQEGDARTLYTRPASAFVARFLGVANLVRGVVQANGSVLVQEGEPAELLVESTPSAKDVYVSIRPEDIRLGAGDGVNTLSGTVEKVSYLGNLVEYVVQEHGRSWRVQSHPQDCLAPGDSVRLHLPPGSCLCLPVS
jgi:iron(III) transport system ATP-binding protein